MLRWLVRPLAIPACAAAVLALTSLALPAQSLPTRVEFSADCILGCDGIPVNPNVAGFFATQGFAPVGTVSGFLKFGGDATGGAIFNDTDLSDWSITVGTQTFTPSNSAPSTFAVVVNQIVIDASLSVASIGMEWALDTASFVYDPLWVEISKPLGGFGIIEFSDCQWEGVAPAPPDPFPATRPCVNTNTNDLGQPTTPIESFPAIPVGRAGPLQTTVTIVPEPAPLGLFGMGIAALAVGRARRRSRRPRPRDLVIRRR